jgi:TPR repeat protein
MMKIILLWLFLLLNATSTFSQSASFRTWFEKAKLGDADAQNELGAAYSEGKVIKQNRKKAVYWFRRSAEQGNALSTCNLGMLYLMGWGVKGNLTLTWKYMLAAHALDSLKCNPADLPPKLSKRHCSVEKGWQLALAWLRAHPGFKNNFGQRPWGVNNGEYPTTLREGRSSVDLPIMKSGRCPRK